MKRKILYMAAFLALSGGGALYLLHGKQEPPKDPVSAFKTVKLEPRTLERVLRLSGQTNARRYVNVNAPLLRGPETNRAMVLMKLVRAGAFVRKGDIVAQIDAQSTQDHIDDIFDTVKQATADVAKRKAEQAIEWENLQQTLRQAKSDMEKARLDAQEAPLLTSIEKELLELNVQETEARYKQLQQNLAQQKASFAAEIRILEITLERQRRHLQRHQHDLERFTVAAPMDGIAVMQTVWRGGDMAQIQQGDQVGPGQLFMKIVDPNSMQLEAKANQAESSDLRIGQKVTIHLDAFPGLDLPGSVYSIGALATGGWMQNYYIRNIPVTLSIAASDPRLIPDLSGSGDVVLAQADSVLAIPLTAVHETNGRNLVRVRRGESFVERVVTLGFHNETQAEVTAGLNRGDEVRLD